MVTEHPLYSLWCMMRRRCEDPKWRDYPRYGGRGIRVCDRWRGRGGFGRFVDDVGPRGSARHSLDRVNNDGNYEPGNVRWATPHEQRRNACTTHFIAAGGERMCITDWAARLRIDPSTIHRRLSRGWSPERAVTTPKVVA
jgi:hypothetical protein